VECPHRKCDVQTQSVTLVHSIVDDRDLFNRQLTARVLAAARSTHPQGTGRSSKDQRSRTRNRARMSSVTLCSGLPRAEDRARRQGEDPAKRAPESECSAVAGDPDGDCCGRGRAVRH
jgi:hypothetical protein